MGINKKSRAFLLCFTRRLDLNEGLVRKHVLPSLHHHLYPVDHIGIESSG